MNLIYKLIIMTIILQINIYGNECINSKSIDITWTSFKTLSKVGVSGKFNTISLEIKNKNVSQLDTFLKDIKVTIDLESIDANDKIKTLNIKKYFTGKIKDKRIIAKIIKVYGDSLNIRLYFNGIIKVIPMTYMIENDIIKASGVIDGLDFKLEKAFKILNMNVPAHFNKGWYDIPIKFNIAFTTECSNKK